MSADLPYRPCAGIMVVNAANQAFTGRRIDHPSNAWQMPQGGIDPGEDVQKAALRELEEETGITADKVTYLAESADWIPYDLPVELQGKFWGGKYKGQMQKWVLFRFDGTDADINIETHEPEFCEWRWMELGDLAAKIVPFKRKTYEQVVAEFTPIIMGS